MPFYYISLRAAGKIEYGCLLAGVFHQCDRALHRACLCEFAQTQNSVEEDTEAEFLRISSEITPISIANPHFCLHFSFTPLNRA